MQPGNGITNRSGRNGTAIYSGFAQRAFDQGRFGQTPVRPTVASDTAEESKDGIKQDSHYIRVLLLTAYFPPETGLAAHLFFDVGKALCDGGYRVEVVTGMPSYHPLEDLTRYRKRLALTEHLEGRRSVA